MHYDIPIIFYQEADLTNVKSFLDEVELLILDPLILMQ